MILNISFKHMDSSDALKVYTHGKCEPLKKYFNGKITVNWNFSMERSMRIAHCHLKGNNMDYFGEAEADDIHAAVEMAVDKIEKQLRRHKEKIKDHKAQGARIPATEEETEESEE